MQPIIALLTGLAHSLFLLTIILILAAVVIMAIVLWALVGAGAVAWVMALFTRGRE